MGAGKSTVGKALAKVLQVPFHDTDDAIVAAAGQPIPKIFATEGEPYFRDLEQRLVLAALRDQTGVVALGGGAPVRAATQAALQAYCEAGGTVVFLDVTPAAAAARVGKGRKRPMLSGQGAGRWAELAEQRRPAYLAVANLTLLTDGAGPAANAKRLAQLLREFRPRSSRGGA
jgi:shikimate kinase